MKKVMMQSVQARIIHICLVNPKIWSWRMEKTYQVAISGISEKLASEAEVTDSGIVGMDAAKEFFGQFKTLSEADAEWK